MTLDPEAKAAVLSRLISFRYLDGPLAGRQVLYANRPENLAEPVLREQRRFDEEQKIDVVARGWYRLEQRDIPVEASKTDHNWEQEGQAGMCLRCFCPKDGADTYPTCESYFSREPTPPSYECVAVHIPSEDDQEWTPYVPPAPPEVPAKEKRPPVEITLPEGHPLALKLAKIKAMKAAQKPKEKPDGQG